METPENRRPSWDELLDFVNGRLSREESLKIIKMAEKDKKLSREIDLVIDIGNEAGRLEREESTKIHPLPRG